MFIAVFPELQYEIGMNNWKTAQKIYRLSMLGVFLMSFIGFVFLAFFGLWFYKIWTHNELEVPQAMWYLFISGMLFNALWWTTEMVFGAVNKPHKMALYGIVGALVSVGLTYLLSHEFGLVGAAIGAVSLDVILVFLVVPYGCKLMRMSLKELLLKGLGDVQIIFEQLRSRLYNFKN